MGAPGILTGSSNKLEIFRATSEGGRPRSGTGVFGPNPGATPKWAINRNPRDAEYKESMARLFIEVPASQAQAFLQTVSAEARPLARTLMSGRSGGTGFIDFLLTNTSESLAEKAQIVDTLTDNYVAFYSGQQPPAFSYQGVLLNTYQDDQRVWMLRLYQEILRGTRLAGRDLIARLRYDSLIVSGYIEQLSLGLTGETDHNASSFQFSLRVKRINVFTPSLGYPTVVETPATTNSILESDGVSSDETARVAVVTPEIYGPSLDFAPREVRTRQALRGAGQTDAQINALMDLAAQTGATLEVDPRERDVQDSQEGIDRLQEVASDGTDSNVNNVSNDGAGGATNFTGLIVEGSVNTELVGEAPPRRTTPRSRGMSTR